MLHRERMTIKSSASSNGHMSSTSRKKVSGRLLNKRRYSEGTGGKETGPYQEESTTDLNRFCSIPGKINKEWENNQGTVQFSEAGFSKAGCSSLLTYFSNLADSDAKGTIDTDYVDSILRGGGDINTRDKYGQNVLIEVVRQWTSEAADYLKSRGIDVCNADAYGRTSLHLAAALDNVEMVRWLLDNGADIHCKTFGQQQSAIHYSAKGNAVRTMQLLMNGGANINDRDFKQRTPLFVAAEQGCSKMLLFLISEDVPVGVYDYIGTPAVAVMIERTPDVVYFALEQFITHQAHSRTTLYHLHYLERITWELLSKKKKIPMRTSLLRTPLKMTVKSNRLDLVMNPVIRKLIKMKWEQFGKWTLLKKLFINCIYTIIWTSVAATLPKELPRKYYDPMLQNSWRLLLELLGLLMTVCFIIAEFIYTKNRNTKKEYEKNQNIIELGREEQFCHPAWPDERIALENAACDIRLSKQSVVKDAWDVLEWITYIGIIALAATRIAFVSNGDGMIDNIHIHIYAVVLILLWLRMMKYLRPFYFLGPFIEMLGHVVFDTLKFLLLFIELFIPYVCGFWILFSDLPEFTSLGDVIYEVVIMTIVGNYTFDPLVKKDKLMAQLLVGTYIALAGIVCLNLYIALLSETFNRVFSNATATTYIRQAAELVEMEDSFSYNEWSAYNKQVLKHYAPLATSTIEMSEELSPITSIVHQSQNIGMELDNTIRRFEENTSGISKLGKKVAEISNLSNQLQMSQNQDALLTKERLRDKLSNTTKQRILRRFDMDSITEDDDSEV